MNSRARSDEGGSCFYPHTMKGPTVISFLLGQFLFCVIVFGGGIWGTALLAPLDIAPALFSKYRAVAPESSGVPANHYIIDQLLSDVSIQTTIYRAYRAGEMPWWDPYTAGGTPLVADGHSNGTDPIRVLLYFLLPFESAYNWTLILHFTISGLGMFLLLRRFGFYGGSCVLLALAYEFGGVFTLFFMHPWVLGTFLYYPYLWIAWDAAVRKGSRWAWLPAAFLVAGVFCAGSVQSHSYLLLFSLAFALGYGGFQRREWKSVWPAIIFPGVLGACLSAPVVVNQLELFFVSNRQVPLLHNAFAFLSAPGSLAAVYPWCLGTFRTLDAGKFIGQNSLGFNLFIGSAAAVLAMAGAFLFAPTDRLSARLRRTALALLGIYLAILATPLLNIFYVRCAPLAMMGLTILAAMGIARMRESNVRFKRTGYVVLALTLMLAIATNIVAFVFYPRVLPKVREFVERRDQTNKSLDAAPALRAFQVESLAREISFLNPEPVLACAGLAGCVCLFLTPAVRRRAAFWVGILALNLAPVICFAQRFTPRDSIRLWHLLQEGGPEQKKVKAKLGGSVYRLWEEAPGLHEFVMPGAMSHLYHVRVAHPYSSFPRGYYFLPRADRERWPSQLADWTYTSSARGQKNGVFSRSTTSDYSRFQWVGAPSRRFTVADLGLRKMRITFEPGDAGMLLWTDSYYPGWTAVVDGQPTGLNRVGQCFCEIEIPKNSRELILAFEPRFLPVGKAFFLAGLVGVSVQLLINILVARQKGRDDLSIGSRRACPVAISVSLRCNARHPPPRSPRASP